MRLVPLLVVLGFALPAHALELPARAEAVLNQGKPFVVVQPGKDGSSGQILAAIDIAAPVEAVWATVTDCALAPRMTPSLKSCRVLERDPAGRWEVREQISKGGILPSVRSVFRSDYDKPRSIRFHRTGGDLEMLEGEWRFARRPDGVTRVTYENNVAAPFRVPGAVARAVLRHEVPLALLALRREAVARSR
jgi:uncharacterized membrane protein